MDKKTPEWGISNFMNTQTFQLNRAGKNPSNPMEQGIPDHNGVSTILFNPQSAGFFQAAGSQQRSMEDHARHREINHQTGDIDQGRHKGG